jgi:hypothetical protein
MRVASSDAVVWQERSTASVTTRHLDLIGASQAVRELKRIVQGAWISFASSSLLGIGKHQYEESQRRKTASVNART